MTIVYFLYSSVVYAIFNVLTGVVLLVLIILMLANERKERSALKEFKAVQWDPSKVRYIELHDETGYRRLVNVCFILDVAEQSDGHAFIVERFKGSKGIGFTTTETYNEVMRKIDFGIELPSTAFSNPTSDR